MINAFLKDVDAHVVCESTNLQGTYDARHMYNVLASADIDNGKLVDLDKAAYLGEDYYSMVQPTAQTTRVGLILSVPVGPDERPFAATSEKNFYNGKDEIMRVYDMMAGDKFTVSANGITALGEKPVVGNFIVADGYDLKEQAKGSAPTVAFYGEIVQEIKRTGKLFYKILVRKNGTQH